MRLLISLQTILHLSLLAISFLLIRAENHQAQKETICQRMTIWYLSDFDNLKGCNVIEGSLQISLMFTNSSSINSYAFPELREITRYLLIFSTEGLLTLGKLFPNLFVIRGQELVDSFALIIMKMNDMQEIGLASLTNILQGAVWIVDNANLCYVDTIDWERISSNTDLQIFKNKKQCPNKCQDDCPKSDDKNGFCWSNENCQIIHEGSCKGQNCDGRMCFDGGCCHKECLGGCMGLGPDHCEVCKGVRIYNRDEKKEHCAETCPDGFFKYFDRRCVTYSQCLKTRSISRSIDQTGESEKSGKIFLSLDGMRLCVLECPKGTELVENATKCVACEAGKCHKTCKGGTIDSVEVAREFTGCTRITGALKIHIRKATEATLNELKSSLDRIEVIEDYLLITYSHSIYDLDFLQSLKIIGGKYLHEDMYALVVKSNENLINLWSSNVAFGNKTARVLFHYNPKLCPNRILDFVKQSGIDGPFDDKMDIGITNGDKVSCNPKKLEMVITNIANSSVTIRWENFRRNLTLTSHLLPYEIYYKEASNYPWKNESKLRSENWNVQEQSKIPDDEVLGGYKNEPKMEKEVSIESLKPFTFYAIYVKAIVIPDIYGLNNNLEAESDILYFRTLSGIPGKPQDFKALSITPDSIQISFKPPKISNGVLHSFRIWIRNFTESQQFQDQRDYCRDGRPKSVANQMKSQPTTTEGSCPKKEVSQQSKIDRIFDENSMLDIIMSRYLFTGGGGETNNNLKNRKRREILEDKTSSADANLQTREENYGMTFYKEIPFDSLHEYSLKLGDLMYYTQYEIGIQACGEMANSTEFTCSAINSERVQTLPSPTADHIDVKSISIVIYEVNRIQIMWTEPTNPNGLVIGYLIHVIKVGDSLERKPECISRKKFQNDGKIFTYPGSFTAGNYSLSIQVVSLAQDGQSSKEMYFYIEDLRKPAAIFWISVTLLPILCLVIVIGCGTFGYVMKKKAFYGPRFSFYNPEYMQNVGIPVEFEVPREKLSLQEEIGSGSFGKVFKGILENYIPNQPRVPCAVKVISIDATSEEKIQFLREASLMTKLHCHHVVNLLGVVSKTIPTAVIMELMATNLLDYLRSKGHEDSFEALTFKSMLRMAAEIADGMIYIHSKNFIHRDLAARNILVDLNWTVKISDFGMTRELKESEYYRKTTKGSFPVRWMAPESIQDGVFTSQSDVWSK